MPSSSVKVVFGGLVPGYPLPKLEEFLSVLEKGGVKDIDTAQMYFDSEKLLGDVHAASRFSIDTKHIGGAEPGESTKEKVIARGEKSLANLQTKSVSAVSIYLMKKKVDKELQVDVFYIHAPDRNYPIEDTLAGINELYKAGKFKRFGLSNFYANEVEDVIRICKEKNFVLPSVYQGNYSAMARKLETDIFPTLRKHNISFYAYSPIAGGFLAKTKDQIMNPEAAGRWSPETFLGKMYQALYNKPALLTALDTWGKISEESGIPRFELAYRWLAYSSLLKNELGDAVIVGASRVEQLQQTLDALKHGPLSEEIVEKINGIWKSIEQDAPFDNMDFMLK